METAAAAEGGKKNSAVRAALDWQRRIPKGVT
jgi:hypothetical protein